MFRLQQLQGIEAVKHPLRQVSDLISIQHAGKSKSRLGLDAGMTTKLFMHTHACIQGPLTGNSGSAGPGRHQELSPRSGCCSGLCSGGEEEFRHGGEKKSRFPGRYGPRCHLGVTLRGRWCCVKPLIEEMSKEGRRCASRMRTSSGTFFL